MFQVASHFSQQIAKKTFQKTQQILNVYVCVVRVFCLENYNKVAVDLAKVDISLPNACRSLR